MTDDSILNPAVQPQNLEVWETPEPIAVVENTETPSREESQEAIMVLHEQLARAQSDYINLVRRSREETSQIGQWTEDKTILKFLPILDNLERALDHIPLELASNSWIEGNKSIVRSMQKVVSDFGITPMSTIGQEINPDLHDVISQIPHSSTTIQAEVEKGYMRWERAIRHAKVIAWDGQVTSE